MADDKTISIKDKYPRTYTFEEEFLEKYDPLDISMPLSAWVRYQLYKGIDEERRKQGQPPAKPASEASP